MSQELVQSYLDLHQAGNEYTVLAVNMHGYIQILKAAKNRVVTMGENLYEMFFQLTISQQNKYGDFRNFLNAKKVMDKIRKMWIYFMAMDKKDEEPGAAAYLLVLEKKSVSIAVCDAAKTFKQSTEREIRPSRDNLVAFVCYYAYDKYCAVNGIPNTWDMPVKNATLGSGKKPSVPVQAPAHPAPAQQQAPAPVPASAQTAPAKKALAPVTALAQDAAAHAQTAAATATAPITAPAPAPVVKVPDPRVEQAYVIYVQHWHGRDGTNIFVPGHTASVTTEMDVEDHTASNTTEMDIEVGIIIFLC